MPFCRKCGVKLDDGDVFCHSCGTPVRTASTKNQNDIAVSRDSAEFNRSLSDNLALDNPVPDRSAPVTQRTERGESKSGDIARAIKSEGRKNRFFRFAIPVLAVLLIAGITVPLILKLIDNKKEKPSITVESVCANLLEVINDTKLDLAEYETEGIANWYNKEADGSVTTVGYVRYKGIITYSLDFKKVKAYEDDDDPKAIVIKLPEINIDSNISKTEPIFIDKKVKSTYDVFQDSFGNLKSLCEDDMKYSLDAQGAMLEEVKKYAEECFRSLTEPIAENAGFSVKVEWVKKK